MASLFNDISWVFFPYQGDKKYIYLIYICIHVRVKWWPVERTDLSYPIMLSKRNTSMTFSLRQTRTWIMWIAETQSVDKCYYIYILGRFKLRVPTPQVQVWNDFETCAEIFWSSLNSRTLSPEQNLARGILSSKVY